MINSLGANGRAGFELATTAFFRLTNNDCLLFPNHLPLHELYGCVGRKSGRVYDSVVFAEPYPDESPQQLSTETRREYQPKLGSREERGTERGAQNAHAH
jgi:hypothetical protein